MHVVHGAIFPCLEHARFEHDLSNRVALRLFTTVSKHVLTGLTFFLDSV